jgi:hypothetical protein
VKLRSGATGGVERARCATSQRAAAEAEAHASLPAEVGAVAKLISVDDSVAARGASSRVVLAGAAAGESPACEPQGFASLPSEVGSIAIFALFDQPVAAHRAVPAVVADATARADGARRREHSAALAVCADREFAVGRLRAVVGERALRAVAVHAGAAGLTLVAAAPTVIDVRLNVDAPSPALLLAAPALALAVLAPGALRAALLAAAAPLRAAAPLELVGEGRRGGGKADPKRPGGKTPESGATRDRSLRQLASQIVEAWSLRHAGTFSHDGALVKRM